MDEIDDKTVDAYELDGIRVEHVNPMGHEVFLQQYMLTRLAGIVRGVPNVQGIVSDAEQAWQRIRALCEGEKGGE